MPVCTFEGNGSETEVEYRDTDVMVGAAILYIMRDVRVTKGEITEDVGLVQGCNRYTRL